MAELAHYQNGNCEVTLLSDGTKIREWPDGEKATPEMPESVDLKITNWCDGGCAWCSEASDGDGRDASMDRIFSMLVGAKRGMEVAVGGGDPMSHPDADTIFELLAQQGLVANVTINAKHAKKWEAPAKYLRSRGYLHGIGLSYQRGMVEEMKCLLTDDTVVHLIVGVHEPEDVVECVKAGFKKFLLLGYKQKGRASGLTYVERSLSWAFFTNDRIELGWPFTLSFDNLALEQLDVQSLVSPEVWRECFMGADGRFTMYLDAVEDAFAASSNHPLRPREGRTLREMFAEVRRG